MHEYNMISEYTGFELEEHIVNFMQLLQRSFFIYCSVYILKETLTWKLLFKYQFLILVGEYETGYILQMQLRMHLSLSLWLFYVRACMCLFILAMCVVVNVLYW